MVVDDKKEFLQVKRERAKFFLSLSSYLHSTTHVALLLVFEFIFPSMFAVPLKSKSTIPTPQQQHDEVVAKQSMPEQYARRQFQTCRFTERTSMRVLQCLFI